MILAATLKMQNIWIIFSIHVTHSLTIVPLKKIMQKSAMFPIKYVFPQHISIIKHHLTQRRNGTSQHILIFQLRSKKDSTHQSSRKTIETMIGNVKGTFKNLILKKLFCKSSVIRLRRCAVQCLRDAHSKQRQNNSPPKLSHNQNIHV